MTCGINGQVFFWHASGTDMGTLLDVYITMNEVGAVHWPDTPHVILVDKGGTQYRPYFYRLKLEGAW
jgi:hypothetical protein